MGAGACPGFSMCGERNREGRAGKCCAEPSGRLKSAADDRGNIGTKPNLALPGKRPLSSMTPTIVLKDGKLSMTAARAVGARFAPSQPTGRPAVQGRWGAAFPTPVVAVHMALLANGKVLAYDSMGDNATESYPVQDHTRATVWDPATGEPVKFALCYDLSKSYGFVTPQIVQAAKAGQIDLDQPLAVLQQRHQ